MQTFLTRNGFFGGIVVKHNRWFVNRSFCTATAPQPTVADCSFQTPETNIDKLSLKDASKYFMVSHADFNKMNFLNHMPLRMRLHYETLMECNLLVRKPYLDVVNCLRHTDPDKPTVRYVFYGRYGCGKSTILNMTSLWGASQDWVVVHVHNPGAWRRRAIDTVKSNYNPERLDLPSYSNKWLIAFKDMNGELINRKKLTTSKSYTWNLKESTMEGDPLINVVNQGIQNFKTASDCFAVLMKELKIHAKEKRIKLMVNVDIVNALFGDHAEFPVERSLFYASIDQVTILRALKKLLKFDWNNGAVVSTVDAREIRQHCPGSPNNSHLPLFLLGREGFDFMEPFLPIEVPAYTDEEMDSVLSYYVHKGWLATDQARSERGRFELKYYSLGNALLLETSCDAW